MLNKFNHEFIMSGKKLHEAENAGKILYKGEMLDRPWDDLDLLKYYKNCTEFLSEVISRFNHVQTDINWNNNAKQSSEEFKLWLYNELKHPELRDCFDNSKNKNIQEIKKLFI